jgi:hypothetical protein
MVGRKTLLIALFVFPTMVMGQSLGELAKKEKKRREKNQEEGVKVRVVDEGEITTEKPEETSADETTLEGETPSSVAQPKNNSRASPGATDRQREEAEWRRRIGEARARLKAAEEHYNFLNGLHLVQGEYYVDENGKPVITSLAQLRRMVDEAKVELDSARAAMEKLREEARRAGVPPGWFR